jgi:hypothetical protein
MMRLSEISGILSAGDGLKTIKILCFSVAAYGALFALLFGCLELTFWNLDRRGVSELPRHAVNGVYIPIEMKSHYHGPVAGVEMTTNRWGLRDEPDFDPTPPAGHSRILVMGDSIAFGLGIQSSDAYAKVLERRLNSVGSPPTYEVINTAGPGYSPSSYYLFLKNQALQWQPRVVLLEIELCNDVTDEALLRWDVDPAQPDQPTALRGGRYVVAWDGLLMSAYTRGPYFYEKTYTYVELSRRALNLLYWLSPTEPFHNDPSVPYYILGWDRYLLDQARIESGWARLFGALQATNELLRARGVTLLVMIMPSRYVFEQPSENRRTQLARSFVTRAVEMARQRGLTYMDFTDTIGDAGGGILFLDFVHLKERGHLAVGTALAAYLSASGALDRSVQ